MISIDDVKIGALYPPYQLDDFQRCPALWDQKKRWQPKPESQSHNLLVGGVLGTAVAMGLEVFYNKSGKDPVAVAEEHAANNWIEDMGLKQEGLVTLARRGTKRGVDTNLGLKEVLGVERSYGRIRPDLVGRNLDGDLVIVDHKVKKNLDDAYKEKTLADFDKSNQFFMYAWAIGQEYGEPVKYVIAHMIVLGPRVYTELHPVKIDQEHLAVWLEAAALDWADMKKGEKRRRFSACNGRYGVCEFETGCHILKGDESRYEAFYDPKKWRS